MATRKPDAPQGKSLIHSGSTAAMPAAICAGSIMEMRRVYDQLDTGMAYLTVPIGLSAATLPMLSLVTSIRQLYANIYGAFTRGGEEDGYLFSALFSPPAFSPSGNGIRTAEDADKASAMLAACPGRSLFLEARNPDASQLVLNRVFNTDAAVGNCGVLLVKSEWLLPIKQRGSDAYTIDFPCLVWSEADNRTDIIATLSENYGWFGQRYRDYLNTIGRDAVLRCWDSWGKRARTSVGIEAVLQPKYRIPVVTAELACAALDLPLDPLLLAAMFTHIETLLPQQSFETSALLAFQEIIARIRLMTIHAIARGAGRLFDQDGVEQDIEGGIDINNCRFHGVDLPVSARVIDHMIRQLGTEPTPELFDVWVQHGALKPNGASYTTRIRQQGRDEDVYLLHHPQVWKD